MIANPLVSIVTPTYNMGNYIDKTIESVLSQDYKNIEYIIINDGSIDNTKELLDKYNNKINIIHQENIGQSRTLNRGWMISRGEYIGYLSADDLIKSNAVSSLINRIRNTDYVVAYPDFELIDSNGRHIRNIETEDFNLNRLTIDLVCQPGPGALFHRKIFESLGGWREDLSQVADFEFWLRAAKFGNFLRVPEVLASFRIHGGSGSFRKVRENNSDEIVRVMDLYWSGSNSDVKNMSLGCAKIISARSHAQSGRYANALKAWVQATAYSPKKALSYSTLRFIILGLSRRMFFRLRNKIK